MLTRVLRSGAGRPSLILASLVARSDRRVNRCPSNCSSAVSRRYLGVAVRTDSRVVGWLACSCWDSETSGGSTIAEAGPV